MQFTIYKDNGGRFHWRLVGDDGARVAVSAASFGSAGDFSPDGAWLSWPWDACSRAGFHRSRAI